MPELNKYYDLPPEQWPKLYFNWDLIFEGQRHALDGVKQEEFAKNYSEGFKLKWVVLKKFDAHLCHFSRRDGLKELWELGNKSSLVNVIDYLSKGNPITPPLVSINDYNHK